MAIYPLRKLPALPCAGLATEWLEKIEAELKSGADRAVLCRRTLCEILHPEFAANWETAVEDKKLPTATRLALTTLDPRNITLEPEYYAEVDDARFQKVKPLLWLWYSFDRTPLGGQNVELGVRLRRILAPHIFKRCGENFKAFQFVEFSFGYNLEVGDNVVVHRYVLLDDRGGISVGNNVSISDFANVYSHTHSIVDQRDVTDAMTRLEDGVRITYHATVLAGVHVGEQAVGGAMAVPPKDGAPDHGYLRIPAENVAPEAAAAAGQESLTTVKPRT